MLREDNLNKEIIKNSKKFRKEIINKKGIFSVKKIIKRIKKDKKINKNSVVLELGGANGWLSEIVSKETSNVYNTDISFCFLKYGKIPSFLIPMNKIDKIFKKESFDIVWVNAALHHCENLDEVFKAVKYVLKKKGIFIISNELIVGKIIKNPDVKKANEAGAQDYPYQLSHYVNTSKKYLKTSIFLPDDLDYFIKNPQVIQTGYKRIIFRLIKKVGFFRLKDTFLFKKIYLAFGELFGAPVLIICEND
ncbi:MAG: methyltransferase domain-containing protein [Nanoarchaeota archaeon]|nr:methyltransferase domain-containing protein [Nanoarchaeota archaeon]